MAMELVFSHFSRLWGRHWHTSQGETCLDLGFSPAPLHGVKGALESKGGCEGGHLEATGVLWPSCLGWGGIMCVGGGNGCICERPGI